jgi:pyruvate formate lyase activating enzyme
LVDFLENNKQHYLLRQVVLKGYSDSVEYIKKLKVFVDGLKYMDKIELLPYHTLGKEKYKQQNIEYKLGNVVGFDKNKLNDLNKILNL